MQDIERIHDIYRPVHERRRDYLEVERRLGPEELREQSTRCMSCGIPFCHGAGCPLGNVIPEINQAVAEGDLRKAYEILSESSPFPEFTSRICPALCENACVHGINDEPVMIRELEKLVIENAFSSGFIKPCRPAKFTGKSVAVVGSGPAGLAAADLLSRLGHEVLVFEKNAECGGLLRYGIPDFKLAKSVIDRRLAVLTEQGVGFECSTEIGRDISGAYLLKHFDAVLLAIGTPSPRDLAVPGRELANIHFALELLQGQNRLNSGESDHPSVDVRDKKVLVIGGGDTGSDCVGTSVRNGAKSVMQIEIMPMPPETRSPSTPWPDWSYVLRSSSSHKEGGERRWNITTGKFLGASGHVSRVRCAEVKWSFSPTGKPLKFTEIPGSEFEIEADVVLLAMGFTGVPASGIAGELNLNIDTRGRIVEDPERNIFAAGDSATGASLVVRAIADGREAARRIDRKLTGKR